MNRGDVEPAVALLDPDVDWRGRAQGHLWWRHAPSCHGPDEARRNLELQVDKGAAGPGVKRVALGQVGQLGESVVVAGGWGVAGGANEAAGRVYQVLWVRPGGIRGI